MFFLCGLVWGCGPHSYLNERFHTNTRSSSYGIAFSFAIVLPAFFDVYQHLLGAVMPLRATPSALLFLGAAIAGVGMALVESRLCDGIRAGEIPSDFPVAVRASQVTDLARGLTMRAQMGTPRKTLLKDAEEAADLVLLPRRGNAA